MSELQGYPVADLSVRERMMAYSHESLREIWAIRNATSPPRDKENSELESLWPFEWLWWAVRLEENEASSTPESSNHDFGGSWAQCPRLGQINPWELCVMCQHVNVFEHMGFSNGVVELTAGCH